MEANSCSSLWRGKHEARLCINSGLHARDAAITNWVKPPSFLFLLNGFRSTETPTKISEFISLLLQIWCGNWTNCYCGNLSISWCTKSLRPIFLGFHYFTTAKLCHAILFETWS
ncbi:hypothetical protein RchiOBHm_Chr5g0027281 [Rosa chinensis]|uniref:Uncharacterized protein n=1 Tax=Rosa chinensis TaxID=74649 RepID=A0A2P6Q929_ROSCH|nr:hypothetical protein RchiOBHm_Chr5g0027281 [Rosa chinensis]